MDVFEVECAEALVSLSEAVEMNLDVVNKVECAKELCSLSKAVEKEENPSFFQQSENRRKPICSKSDSKLVVLHVVCQAVPLTTRGIRDSLSATFLTEKVRSRKTFEKNVLPTLGHSVCSKHFPDGKKDYMSRLRTVP